MWKGAGPQGGPTQIRNKARGLIEAQVVDLLPTPVAQPSGNTPEEHLRKKPGRTAVTDLAIIAENGLIPTGGQLLPTPRTSDTNGPGLHGDGGMDLRTAATLLPTPRAQNSESRNQTIWERPADQPQNLENALAHVTIDWGPYAPAIHRWERALGRPAPSPTEPNKNGKPRLSPAFTEWMMGVPEGWICGTPGVSRNEQLKAAGNGVVPQQAAAALADMLAAINTH